MWYNGRVGGGGKGVNVWKSKQAGHYGRQHHVESKAVVMSAHGGAFA